MMKHPTRRIFQPALLFFLLRKFLIPTGFTATALALYTLLHRDLLTWHDFFPIFFAAAHAALLARSFGRFASSEFAFLYTRGFPRDTLFLHLYLASALSTLVALLPTAWLIWSGARSGWQCQANNPIFPAVAVREYAIPFYDLAWFAVAIPAAHYTWIRLAMSARDRLAGVWLVIAMIITLLMNAELFFQFEDWLGDVLLVGGVIMISVWILGGRCAHRDLELQS